MGRWSWRMGVVAAVVAACVVGLAVGRLLPDWSESVGDHRAYPLDSGRVSLEEGLQRAEIVLPDCVGEDDLRYAWHYKGFSYHQDAYLMFRTSTECVNAFLAANGMVAPVTRATQLAGPESVRQPTYEFYREDIFAELGWEINPEQRFEQFGVHTAGSYNMTAFIRYLPGSSDVRVYVYAYRAG